MGVLTRIASRLDYSPDGRRPHPADRRHMVGSWAARSLLQYFAVEYLVMLSWTRYNYLYNVASDLGARNCNDVVANQCPASGFVIADLSYVSLGVGTLMAAVYITSSVLRVGGHVVDAELEPDPPSVAHDVTIGRDHRRANRLRLVLALSGLALVGVGLFPEDYAPAAHRTATTIFVIGSVVSLLLLAALWREPRPPAAWAIFVLAVIAGAGALIFGWFSFANIHGAPAGLFERMVIYGFIFGMAVMGWTLSRGAATRTSKANRQKNASTLAA